MGEMSDEEWSRRCEAFERQAVEEFLTRFERTGGQLREGIEHLVREREKLRDEQLASLEREAGRLVLALQNMSQRKLLRELEAFRDVMSLHRRLLEKNGEHGA